MDEENLTVAEAAKIKGVSRHTIYKAIHENHLKHKVDMKPTYTITAADLAEWKPASGGGVQREKVRRGPGRPRKATGE